MDIADLIHLQEKHDIAIVSAKDLDTSLFATPIYYELIIRYDDQVEHYYILSLANQTKALDLLKDEIIFNTPGSIIYGYQGQQELHSFDSQLKENIFHTIRHSVLLLADYPFELLLPHLRDKHPQVKFVSYRFL